MKIDYKQITDNCLVVVTTDSEHEWDNFASNAHAMLADNPPTNVTLCRLRTGTTIDVIPEQEMNAAGWFRKDK